MKQMRGFLRGIDTEVQRDATRVLDDLLDLCGVEVRRRVHGERVARVHAGSLHVLHDAGD